MSMILSECNWARGVVLALLLVACAAGVSGGNDTGRWGWSSYSPDVLRLYCYSSSDELPAAQHLEDVDIPSFNRTEMQLSHSGSNLTLLGAELHLASCPWPRGSLADALAALQYPVAELQELRLKADHPPRAEHFAGLHLKKLEINFDMKNMSRLNPTVFSSLAELSELKISGAILSSMPTTSRLKTVTLLFGRSTGAWGGCAELRELTLIEWEVPAAGEGEWDGWLAHCPQLSTVDARAISGSSFERALRGARALSSLVIWRGMNLSAMELDSTLSGLPLRQLFLPYNLFKLISENTLSTSLEKLTLDEARLFGDKEENQRVVRKLARLPALQDLDFGPHSYFFDFCELFPENGSLPALRRLTLRNTMTNKYCFSSWESLEYLDISYISIRELELVQLPPVRAHALLVDLRLTGSSRFPIRDIPLDEAGYNILLNRLNEGANVTVLADINLNCDCNHLWVARALRTLPLSVPGARCENYGDLSLADVPIEPLECSQFECGQCTCQRAWRDNATTATCDGWATRAPHVPDLRALDAAGSLIDTLYAEDLPDTLLTLNFTNSKISRLDDSAIAALFSVSARKIWLAGCPLACDCFAQPLQAALQRHRAQIPDFANATCEDGRSLNTLDVDELCGR